MNFEKILVLSPHPDDGELGAGGTIARFLEENREVYYIAFSSCEKSIPTELAKDTLIIVSSGKIPLSGRKLR